VLVLSTGSELVAPGEPLLPGQIYESNSRCSCAAVEEAGGEARRLHFVPDDVDQFLTTVRAELATADLLITSGGVSAGAYEVVKDAFRGLGTVEFAQGRDAARRPQGAGTVDGVPVVTLPATRSARSSPSRCSSAPRCAAPSGTPPRPAARPGPADRPLRSPAGTRPVPARPLRRRRGLPGRRARSHLVAHLARANCLVVVPEDVTELPAGAEVDVVLIEGALQ
jgi:molybdopterin molybdotransferase